MVIQRLNIKILWHSMNKQIHGAYIFPVTTCGCELWTTLALTQEDNHFFNFKTLQNGSKNTVAQEGGKCWHSVGLEYWGKLARGLHRGLEAEGNITMFWKEQWWCCFWMKWQGQSTMEVDTGHWRQLWHDAGGERTLKTPLAWCKEHRTLKTLLTWCRGHRTLKTLLAWCRGHRSLKTPLAWYRWVTGHWRHLLQDVRSHRTMKTPLAWWRGTHDVKDTFSMM